MVFRPHQVHCQDPKLFIADTGLLCALLNIRSEQALRQSPAAGAVWETFVFQQLRDRERRAGRTGSLFFWRDRTREVDFLIEVAGTLELFEARWTELPTSRDTVNLEFVPRAMANRALRAGPWCHGLPIVFRWPTGFEPCQ